MLRFLDKCKTGGKRTGELTVTELENAEMVWCKAVQNEIYPKELKFLKSNKNIAKSSPIYMLSPKLDDKGLIRVSGRLSKSTHLSENTKYPIILPCTHEYTRLLINHVHLKFGHNEMETVANELRQKFWIPRIRVAIRSVWSSCQFCRNRRAKTLVPKMGELPSVRINWSNRPFTATGMDYFGPIHVKTGKKI